MSKIICDICGTSYPDTADCCPICGCAKDGSGLMEDALLEDGAAEDIAGQDSPKRRKEIFDYDEVNSDIPEPEPTYAQTDYDYDDDDFMDDYDDDYDSDGNDYFEIQCPNCGEDVMIDFDMIDDDNAIVCPNCHGEIELEFDVDEDDEE